MGYPILADWIRLERKPGTEWVVYNTLLDDFFFISDACGELALRLDGKTDPYKINPELRRREVRELLSVLEERGMIRDKWFFSKSVFNLMITLWRPKITDSFRVFAYISNHLLMAFWLPAMIFGAYRFIEVLPDIRWESAVFGGIIGLVIGAFMHEMGHMLACISYGGHCYELGLMLWCFIPGAYVILDENRIKSRMRKAQIYAAGVEMNFLLSGISIILSTFFEDLSGFFLGMAINNLFMGFINLIFVNGFDGAAIIGQLLGVAKKISS